MTHSKTDASSAAIIDCLRALGGYWFDQTMNRKAGCDGIALFHGVMAVVEIKDGDKPPSARHLTANEIETQYRVEHCDGTYLIWQSPDDVIAWCQAVMVGGNPTPTPPLSTNARGLGGE